MSPSTTPPADPSAPEHAPGDVVGEVQREIEAGRFTLAEFCRRARIDPTTFRRNRAGHYEPRGATTRKMRDALKDLLGELPRAPDTAPRGPPAADAHC